MQSGFFIDIVLVPRKDGFRYMGKNFKGTPREERALSAYVKLARAANAALVYARASFDDSGLTPSQFAVLEALFHVGPLCLGDGFCGLLGRQQHGVDNAIPRLRSVTESGGYRDHYRRRRQ
ncbi:MAG: hypothetical protein ACHP79_06935 [Terriglobales bacterium]